LTSVQRGISVRFSKVVCTSRAVTSAGKLAITWSFLKSF
jgi:hypothetical protein